MHILIIPSEEFLPPGNITNGIFQYHQGTVLQKAGHKIGVLSIKQSFSIPMILKALFFKLFGIGVKNECDKHSFFSLVKIACRKIFEPHSFVTQEKIDGIDVLRIDGFYYGPPKENENHFGWTKAGLAAFKKYIDTFGKPDIIHAHNALYAGMLASAIKQKHGVRYLLTEHSTVFARNIIQKKQILQRIKKTYNGASLLTCVSQPFCELLNQKFSTDRFQCLHNVLDPTLEHKELLNVQEKSKNFVFINIAELHPKKDHHILIKGFKKVYLQNPNTRLVIGGFGELEEELKALVAKEKLEGVVQFLGLLSREQVFSELQKADCFVLTSKYETFGVVVIESMLVGKPVIVTNCGGPESFVTNQTGLVIEKENVEQLSQSMSAIIAGVNDYNKDYIRQYAIERFGSKSFEKTLTGFYNQVLGKEPQHKIVPETFTKQSEQLASAAQ